MNKQIQTISVPAAGAVLGIGRNVAFRLAREGVIPALRLGKKLRVPKRALEDLLKNPRVNREVTQ